MTNFVNIISAGIRPPDEQRVVALLHDDTIPETRQVVVIMQRGFDAHDHIAANFVTYFTNGLVVNDAWQASNDVKNLQKKKREALDAIATDIALIDSGSYTNAEIVAITRGNLVRLRKIINFVVND